MSARRKKSSPGTTLVFLVCFLAFRNAISSAQFQAVEYDVYRNDSVPTGVTRRDARTTRGILEQLLQKKANHPSSSYNLQDITEHILQYGALLRTQILDTFGNLVYDHYDDFGIAQVEALFRVYQETLERKYNIFDILRSVLNDPDSRPSRICSHIHEHVHTCLKESSLVCMGIRKHDVPHPDTLSTSAHNITKHIYKTAEVARFYPRGFSLRAILKHLQNGTLQFTPMLFSGLLHNVQYDSFDDEVRTAERELVRYLSRPGFNRRKSEPLLPAIEFTKVRTVSALLKHYLENGARKFKSISARYHAGVLAEHVVREINAINRNIEHLGTIYENNTIRLGYLFQLVLPQDLVDEDIVEARKYLLKIMNEQDVVRKYLSIEKYQQSGPDQLLMEILGQLRDIDFAVDIATALHTHARFWHQNHMIDELNELLELFTAYANLRNIPQYEHVVLLMDSIRENLWNSKNVTIEMSCDRPRPCLVYGLEVILECIFVNDETKYLIIELLKYLTRHGSLIENICPFPMTSTTHQGSTEVESLRSSTTTELFTKPFTEPSTETPLVSTTEFITESTTGSTIQSSTETTVESFTESTTASVSDSTTESTTSEFTSESTTDSTTGFTTETTSDRTTESTTEFTTEFTTHVTTDSSTEPTTETTTEHTTEPTTEHTTEPTTESTTEPTTELTTETTTEPTTEPTSKFTGESTGESTTESTTELTTEPTTESTTESTTELTTEPTTESTTESTTELTTEVTTELTTEVTTELTTEVTTELTTELTTEPTTEPTTESTTELTTEPTTEPTSKFTGESTGESTTESTTELTTEPTTESTTELTTEPTTAPTSEFTTKLTTESTTDSITEDQSSTTPFSSIDPQTVSIQTRQSTTSTDSTISSTTTTEPSTTEPLESCESGSCSFDTLFPTSTPATSTSSSEKIDTSTTTTSITSTTSSPDLTSTTYTQQPTSTTTDNVEEIHSTTEQYCTGDDCSLSCSGEDCSSSDCPGGDCSISECPEGGCSYSECSGEDCSPCEGDDCSAESCSDESCPDVTSTPGTVPEECQGADCQSSQNYTSTTKEGPAATTMSDKCNNKDPHHQRKKERLEKMRKQDALHAMTAVTENSLEDKDRLFGNKITADTRKVLTSSPKMTTAANVRITKLSSIDSVPSQNSDSVLDSKSDPESDSDSDSGSDPDQVDLIPPGLLYWGNININKNINVAKTRRQNSPQHHRTGPKIDNLSKRIKKMPAVDQTKEQNLANKWDSKALVRKLQKDNRRHPVQRKI